MLIFEGPDNSGKSTIAAHAAHELGIPLHHFGGPPKHVSELITRIKFMFYYRDKYIFDRVPLISEQVYSILRPVNLINQLDDDKVTSFYKELREIEPVIVYCRPPLEILLDTAHAKKEHDTPEHINKVLANTREIVDRYDQVMEDAHMPRHWVFDYTKQEHDVFLREIENEVIKRGFYKERKNAYK